MAICNILGNLKSNTGTFLTFSQYIDDLTRWQSDLSYYEITPSKFVALNIKPLSSRNIINGSSVENIKDYNSWISTVFVNFIENRCAWLKTNDKNGSWTPNHFKNVFWEVMTKQLENVSDINVIDDDGQTITATNSDSIISNEDIVYVGDINVQSYDNVNGQGYSEIYCYIPNKASRGSYEITKTSSQDSLSIDPVTIPISTKLIGFENIGSDSEYITSYNMLYDEPEYNYNIEKVSNYNDDNFNINAIIILYSIGDEYIDIPMGIYFPGIINNEGVIQNQIIKYVNNNDLYGSGTSYGLRICNRYATANDSNNIDINIYDTDYAGLSKVLAKMSDTCDKMTEVINKFNSNNDVNKSLIDLFKNTQVNVPYIKSVNGVDYWFVNGKKLTQVYK